MLSGRRTLVLARSTWCLSGSVLRTCGPWIRTDPLKSLSVWWWLQQDFTGSSPVRGLHHFTTTGCVPVARLQGEERKQLEDRVHLSFGQRLFMWGLDCAQTTNNNKLFSSCQPSGEPRCHLTQLAMLRHALLAFI